MKRGVMKSVHLVPVEYGTFAQTFHFEVCFFQFITSINFKWDYVLWHIIDLTV